MILQMLILAKPGKIAIEECGGIEHQPQKQKTEHVGLNSEYACVNIQHHGSGNIRRINKGKKNKNQYTYYQRIGPEKRNYTFTTWRISHLDVSLLLRYHSGLLC